MSKRFKDRLNSYKHSNDHVSHVTKKPDMTQGGGGKRHLDVYGPRHSTGAMLGANWAMAPQLDPTGNFHHTNGLQPDVHGHVIPFTNMVNQTGGVTQPATQRTDADVARASIKNNRPRFHVSGQGSGRDFWSQRQKIRSGVEAKVSKDK